MDKDEGTTAGPPPAGRRRPRKARGGAPTAADPRARMLAAMLASVGERGYMATAVADVIAGAVASRKTFYEHFGDKRDCFFAASDMVVGEWVGRVGGVETADGASSAIDALVNTLFDLALASPASLRVLAVELTAVGADGIERRERALDGLARPLREALGEDSPATELRARVLVGAILRMLYARARRGARVRRPRRDELIAMAPQVAAWAACYVPWRETPLTQPAGESAGATAPVGGRAPGTLSLGSRATGRRGLPRGEGSVSRSFVVHNQRERIIDALANLSLAQGYGATTIPEIVQEAAVSVQAFYEHFAGKEDLLLVAYEIGHRKALAIVERAYESHEDWQAAVRAGIQALLGFLASEPAYAHLALIDALTASPRVMTAALQATSAYAAMLEPGLQLSEHPEAALMVEATARTLAELCFVYVAAERTRELPSLGELAREIALRPFVGTSAI